MVAITSSSLMMRISPPSILNRAPAYRPIQTQSPSLHQGSPSPNLSLSLYAKGPTRRLR